MEKYGHWNIEIVGEFDPENWFGFVYLIRNKETNQKYIGRKQFSNRNRKKVKDRKNRKVVISESNWKLYTSSSEDLNILIEDNISNFEFIILKLCRTKRDLGYEEVKEQFSKDVLNSRLENGEKEYYNKNIM